MISPVELPAVQPIAPPLDQSWGQLKRQGVSKVAWIWQGYLARGNVTLLTSQWKTGKTTLLSVLIARMRTGGKLADLAVEQGRAAIVTEEHATHWRLRAERLNFDDHTRFFCRPFTGKPVLAQWLGLIDRLAELREKQQIDLAVIDTVASLMPLGVETNADLMMAALRPLEKLGEAGLAVLLMHHPRKGQTLEGQSARGTGALSSYADVLIEMRTATKTPDDRRRRLSAHSRHTDTPRELTIELSADGGDYRACEAAPDDKVEAGVKVIEEVLGRADQQLTRQRILSQWPERNPPSLPTLWRWLDVGLARGKLVREGTGQRGDPMRYILPGRKLPFEQTLGERLDEMNDLL